MNGNDITTEIINNISKYNYFINLDNNIEINARIGARNLGNIKYIFNKDCIIQIISITDGISIGIVPLNFRYLDKINNYDEYNKLEDFYKKLTENPDLEKSDDNAENLFKLLRPNIQLPREINKTT